MREGERGRITNDIALRERPAAECMVPFARVTVFYFGLRRVYAREIAAAVFVQTMKFANIATSRLRRMFDNFIGIEPPIGRVTSESHGFSLDSIEYRLQCM